MFQLPAINAFLEETQNINEQYAYILTDVHLYCYMLFNLYLGLYQVLLHRVRVGIENIVAKR